LWSARAAPSRSAAPHPWSSRNVANACRRDNAKWEPPGGVLELGESIIDALRREVHEETGFDIAPERLTDVYKNMNHGIVALVFRARITGWIATPSHRRNNAAGMADSRSGHRRCDEAYAV
jgi:ADP-ribose pyrophosphatase YjhB (NUDIX family)